MSKDSDNKFNQDSLISRILELYIPNSIKINKRTNYITVIDKLINYSNFTSYSISSYRIPENVSLLVFSLSKFLLSFHEINSISMEYMPANLGLLVLACQSFLKNDDFIYSNSHGIISIAGIKCDNGILVMDN